MVIDIFEYVWIFMFDGMCFSVWIFLFDGLDGVFVFVVLEYIFYCKCDGMWGCDVLMYGYFVQVGYVVVCVDICGLGDSEGLLVDEYLVLEQDDVVEVIVWIVCQLWCDGNVGMMGKSWLGFNVLQVVVCCLFVLKVIIICYFIDDWFKDDIYFMNGCLLNDNLWWGLIMMVYQVCLQDFEIIDFGWCVVWEKWLEMLLFFFVIWVEY